MTYHELVYAVARQIPRGRVTTYGAIADFLALGASRMVGWALNKSILLDGVPAHRVVNRKGELSGRIHFPTKSPAASGLSSSFSVLQLFSVDEYVAAAAFGCCVEIS